jgi:hypothetical protein
MGATLERLRHEFAGLETAELRKKIEWLVANEAIRIFAARWGWCVYLHQGLCGGNERGPNEITASSEICPICPNHGCGPEHRPYIRDLIERDRQVYDHPRATPGQRADTGHRMQLWERAIEPFERDA